MLDYFRVHFFNFRPFVCIYGMEGDAYFLDPKEAIRSLKEHSESTKEYHHHLYE